MSAQAVGPDFEGVAADAWCRSYCVDERPLDEACESCKQEMAPVAAALRAEVGRWLGSEGAVSVAAQAANDAPNGAWLVLPGPVNIARSLVQPALAALAECVGVEEVGA